MNGLLGTLLLLFLTSGASAQHKKVAPGPVDEAVQILKNYIRIDTTNPPGREEMAAQYLKSLLDKEGIPSEIFISTPGRGNLLARLKAAKPTAEPPLLLLHHMDVVPANPEDWSVNPFEAVEKDGFVWGRGALDSKLTGVVHLMTFLQLKRRNVPLNRDVLFMAVSDEEGGGVWGTQWMLEHHGDVVRPGYVLDEGGFGQRGVFSAQPDNVYACAVTEKKHLALRVTARGKSGHGALPNTDNPNDILRRALTRIEQTFIRYDGRPPDVLREIERRLSRIRRSSVWDVMRRNTVTVTSLLGWGGDYKDPKVNFIPDRAIATLDCRLLPSEDEAALVQRLNEAIDDGRVTIDILKQTKVTPPYTGYQTPLFGALEKAVKENDPDGIVVPCLLHMSSDSRFFRAKGAVCYGLIPVVLTEEEYYLLHANDERVPVASLENGLRIMYDWVKNFCTETANGTDR